MATSILEAGLTKQESSTFTVNDGECVLVSVFNPNGLDIPPGPVLTVQRQDINGNFITLSTVGYASIRLMQYCQQVTISMPGVYRVARPDISAWNFEIGVAIGA